MRKILVTGATGFTGRHVLPLLVERYGSVACFVRPKANRAAFDLPGVEIIEGDLDDYASIEAALRGKDTLISIAYLIGRIEQGGQRAEHLVRASRTSGVRRAVVVSSTSIFTTLAAPAKAAKIAAEQAIIESGLDYTILRPTMIYGTAHDRNMIRLIRFLRRSPVIFVPGDGRSRQQPIHVDDVAQAIVDCLEVRATFGKAYNISGARPVTFDEVIDQTCDALKVKRLKIHLPVKPALVLAQALNGVRKKALIKEEQILRLNEDKSFDHSEAQRDFNFSPRSFVEGIRQEVAQA